jgi:hypothetical protein
MSTRIRVRVGELEEKWMSPDARGLANNLKLGVRIVTMADGTQYETPLDEVSAALAADEAAEQAVRRCRSCGCTDDDACLPPCWWVEDDLCSACHPGQPTQVHP